MRRGTPRCGSHAKALLALIEAEPGVTSATAAEKTGLSRDQASAYLSNLRRFKHVKSERDPMDKRIRWFKSEDS